MNEIIKGSLSSSWMSSPIPSFASVAKRVFGRTISMKIYATCTVICMKIKWFSCETFCTSTCTANGSSDGGSQVSIMSQAVHQASTPSSFCSRKWLGVFLLPHPLDGMPVHYRATPKHWFCQYLFIHLRRYWGTVRVKCFAQEHNTIIPARAWTQTTWNREIQKSNSRLFTQTAYNF